MSAQNPIHLHIERLVVDEPLVASCQGAVLQAAIETELSRLLLEGGVATASGSAVPSLNAGNIRVSNGSRPAQFGRQIAQSIHRAINPANPVNAANNPTAAKNAH